jgi:hypothetical protein
VSYVTPSALPKDGAISGTFPGGDKQYTWYYFAADLKAGDLLSQISFAGRANEMAAARAARPYRSHGILRLCHGRGGEA